MQEPDDFFPACQGLIYQGVDLKYWGMDLCEYTTIEMTSTGVQIQFQRGSPPLRRYALVGSAGAHLEPFLWIHHKRWMDLNPAQATASINAVQCAGLAAITRPPSPPPMPPPSPPPPPLPPPPPSPPPVCVDSAIENAIVELRTDIKEDRKSMRLYGSIMNNRYGYSADRHRVRTNQCTMHHLMAAVFVCVAIKISSSQVCSFHGTSHAMYEAGRLMLRSLPQSSTSSLTASG